MSRLPTAFTSSTEPVFTPVHWLPGSITLSGLTLTTRVSPLAGAVPGEVLSGLVAEGVTTGMSPPTGVVPGAGSALGVVDETLLGGGVLDAGSLDGVDCAQAIAAKASANPASDAAWEALRIVLTASPPAQIHSRSLQPAPLFRL